MAFMLSLMCVLTAQGAEPADTIATPAPEESPERGSGAPSPDLPAELQEPK